MDVSPSNILWRTLYHLLLRLVMAKSGHNVAGKKLQKLQYVTICDFAKSCHNEDAYSI
jgi:hypothetical protein